MDFRRTGWLRSVVWPANGLSKVGSTFIARSPKQESTSSAKTNPTKISSRAKPLGRCSGSASREDTPDGTPEGTPEGTPDDASEGGPDVDGEASSAEGCDAPTEEAGDDDTATGADPDAGEGPSADVDVVGSGTTGNSLVGEGSGVEDGEAGAGESAMP